MPSLKVHVYWCRKFLEEMGYGAYAGQCYELNRMIDFGLKHDMFWGSVVDSSMSYPKKAKLSELENKEIEKILMNPVQVLVVYQHFLLDSLRDLLYVAGYLEDGIGFLEGRKDKIVNMLLEELKYFIVPLKMIKINDDEYKLFIDFHVRYFNEILKSIVKYRRVRVVRSASDVYDRIMREIIKDKLVNEDVSYVKLMALKEFINKLRKTKLDKRGIESITRLLTLTDDENQNKPGYLTYDNRSYPDSFKMYKKYTESALESGYASNRYEAEYLSMKAFEFYAYDKFILDNIYAIFKECNGISTNMLKFQVNIFLKSVKKYSPLRGFHKAAYAVTLNAVYYLSIILRTKRACIKNIVCNLGGYCYRKEIEEAIDDALSILNMLSQFQSS